MNDQGFKAIFLAMIVTMGVAAAAFLYFSNPSIDAIGKSNVISIRINGNSSDIIFDELMDASIDRDALGNWQVSASFLDNSEGWEYPEPYERTFTISYENVSAISYALIAGLNQTYLSEDTEAEVMDPYPHIGFDIEIIYSDGTWIYVCTFQTEKGHFVMNRGSGTSDRSLMGPLMEPVSALNGLVTIVQAIFSSNM
ncbi:MAG: hypothetical protein ACFFF4_17750 [Candidatus Thorarchaeota archaeon]